MRREYDLEHARSISWTRASGAGHRMEPDLWCFDMDSTVHDGSGCEIVEEFGCTKICNSRCDVTVAWKKTIGSIRSVRETTIQRTVDGFHLRLPVLQVQCCGQHRFGSRLKTSKVARYAKGHIGMRMLSFIVCPQA